jgi:hypothetical protein
MQSVAWSARVVWRLPRDSSHQSVGNALIKLPAAPFAPKFDPRNGTCTEQASFLCCSILSLGCIVIAGAELFLVFYLREAGLGQRWLETIEMLAGGRFKATATEGWQFQRID